ncbi:glycosyltransferase [candidate division KSB3 bacterium]|uniref:Glycosyltransferase n=1 Tax=candidate division KSB3 bacterium TaxID=2044937 RepID=A0A9D5JUG9_9BACT|nr:glycosyltransferase [candidate division KSB3 bacterium]MBD3324349.1 glycosyltransferase [candidate division KSB3 bacterium]
MTSVIFSIGVRLPGEGMGNHAYNTALGLDRHHLLKRAFLMQYHGTGLDPAKVKTCYLIERITFRLSRHTGLNKYVLRDNAFDWWISHQLEPATVFYGWNHLAWWSIRRAKRLGMLTILERANSHPNTYTRLLAEEHKKRGIPYSPYHPLIFKKHLRELEETDYIAVTSEFTRQGLLEEGIDEDRILLTPLGVDPEHFVPLPPDSSIRKGQEANTPERFRVLYVGQICVRKGIPYLLEAWRKLRLRQAELVLVGDVVDDVKDLLARYLHQDETITLLPHTPDPVRAYQNATLFILPSLEDGFGLVVLEAMACGLPVIVTEHTGAKDCVRHAVDGWIIPPYSVESIAETLRYCYDHREKLAVMGTNARQQAEYFSWQRYQEDLVAQIKRITA